MFKLKTIVLATMLSTAMAAQAGQFQTLRTDLTSLNTTGLNPGLVTGANNSNSDKLYIETTSTTLLAGYDDTTPPADVPVGSELDYGNVVPTSITYRAFTGSTTNYTGTLTLLDWHVTKGQPLTATHGIGFDADGNDLADAPQADIFDFVYRDSLDNSLVFGMRYLNRVDNNNEANYLFRYGFNGYSTATAWTFVTDGDLRMYQAGRTNASTHALPVAYDSDAVRFKSDVSVSEGNPWSALFLVKTDATTYSFADGALGWGQAGEEGQAVVRNAIAGFAPGNVLAVPEPETYGMMLLGLGLIAGVARRKQLA